MQKPRTVEQILEQEFVEIDIEEQFHDYMQEMYDFSNVGGPFQWMNPAHVLQEFDKVAYDQEFENWKDSCTEDAKLFAEFEETGTYWHPQDIEDAIEMAKEEMNDYLEYLKDAIKANVDEIYDPKP